MFKWQQPAHDDKRHHIMWLFSGFRTARAVAALDLWAQPSITDDHYEVSTCCRKACAEATIPMMLYDYGEVSLLLLWLFGIWLVMRDELLNNFVAEPVVLTARQAYQSATTASTYCHIVPHGNPLTLIHYVY